MVPVYLNGPTHRLLVVVHLPEATQTPCKWLLHVPAFAEEMNKSRAMVADQARAFARSGVAVVVPDLRGIGDSEGDFAEASWEGWKDDVEFLLQWMHEQGAQQVSLWGLRLGALLAIDVASTTEQILDELLLWQPVLSGKQAVTQFLRLRMAAGMMQGQAETVADLRSRSSAGETLEVAGYLLSPQLLIELDVVDAKSITLPESLQVAIFELGRDEQQALTPAVRGLVENWRSSGNTVNTAVVSGEPFWSTQEISSAPALIAASLELVLTSGICDKTSIPFTHLASTNAERPLVFECKGEQLMGVLHEGEQDASRGILLVVGGPQYRVGSHRQFISLARELALQGIPVFRFDYRGMGDSSGEPINFLGAADDIHAALGAFIGACPRLEQFVLWGLCDAATAATSYAPSDSRVVGLILLNPWVRSEAGEAKAYIKHYYLQRLLSRGFWEKILGGQFKLISSLRSLFEKICDTLGWGSSVKVGAADSGRSLAECMERDLSNFRGKVLLITSGNDLTAAEFLDSISASTGFTNLIDSERFSISRIPEADHTFSRKIWKNEVNNLTADWVSSL